MGDSDRYLGREMDERLIWRGRISDVFTWGDRQVLKLFRGPQYVAAAEQEARVTQWVRETGLNLAHVEGVVRVEGRPGIVYEWIEGPSMAKRVRSRPWSIVRIANVFAELHAAVHARSVSGLPSQRQEIETKIRNAPLPEAIREEALRMLGSLSETNVLCHGDFHPYNVLMTPSGPVIVDWGGATQGDPLIDVATTLTLLPERRRPSRHHMIVRWIGGAAIDLFRRAYLKRYLQLRPMPRELPDRLRLPVAVARLAQNAPEEEAYLLGLIQASLSRRGLSELRNTMKPA